MSVFSALVNALASDPQALTTAIGAAATGLQTQVSGAVTPSITAVTTAANLMPQLELVVGLGQAAATAQIAGQIVAIPNLPPDIKNAALFVQINAADPKSAASYLIFLKQNVANDQATAKNISTQLGLPAIPSLF